MGRIFPSIIAHSPVTWASFSNTVRPAMLSSTLPPQLVGRLVPLTGVASGADGAASASPENCFSKLENWPLPIATVHTDTWKRTL